ncbi:MAG: outer membrane lipoprotein-sorting protein, partial [Deltaproteobacteria bacterium]|nr:outer membrane lipoprotein-sorting protein [Deltaproteobacteria bacterium]
MPSTTLTVALATLALALPGVSAADSPAEPAGARRCLQRPLPERSSAQTVQIHTLEGDEIATTITARVLWKRLADGRHGGLMRLLEPPEVAGMSALVREREAGAVRAEGARGTEIFLYLPELRRVRRVSVHQATTSLFGTAFSYADFDRIQGHAKASHVESRGKVFQTGRRAYMVVAEPPAAESMPYTK